MIVALLIQRSSLSPYSPEGKDGRIWFFSSPGLFFKLLDGLEARVGLFPWISACLLLELLDDFRVGSCK